MVLQKKDLKRNVKVRMKRTRSDHDMAIRNVNVTLALFYLSSLEYRAKPWT